MTATCTVATVTNPVTTLNVTGVTATGTCTALNTVTVTITDSLGTAAGPTAATVVGTGWTLAATSVSTLTDGPITYTATATDGAASAAASLPATKTTGAQNYITLAELRAYMHDTSTLDTGPAQAAIMSASRQVDAMCGRYFYQDGVVSARTFCPDNRGRVSTDDISTTTGLLVDVDSAGDGTYAQPWTITTDFLLEPTNGVTGGITGHPYTTVRATLVNYVFPTYSQLNYEPVRVTAKWGWAAVPADVKQATFVLAAQLYKMGDAPFGNAGFGEFGIMRVRENPIALALLRPFMIDAGYVTA